MNKMVALIAAAVALVVLVGFGGIWLGARTNSSAPPAQPAAQPSAPAASSTASVRSSPAPSRPAEEVVEVGGVELKLTERADSDAVAQAEAVLRYLRARNDIDASRPWPGLDVATVKASVSGELATRTASEARDWDDPSGEDLEAYQSDRTWAQSITVNSLTATSQEGKPVIVADYSTEAPTEQHRKILAYTMARTGGGWTCDTETTPQAL